MGMIHDGMIAEKLKANFMEMEPALTKYEAVEEANRCLYCYDAACTKACPTSIDIPKFIKKIASGNMKGSARTILQSNPLGASCARVCPTEELCEGACVLNHQSKPIDIGRLQRYATDWAMASSVPLFKKGVPQQKKIAIVGSGPAGLAAARELACFGYEVTIYEAQEKAGGLGRYGIVAFRLPNDVVEWEVEQVEKLGVKIYTGTTVGKDVAVADLMNDYDAVVLAIGMGDVPDLRVKGEELEGVHDAIEFVKQTKLGHIDTSLVGKRVAVIGAGNTAIDGATSAARLGASNVKILYRRTEAEMTAYEFEYEFAKQEGVQFDWLTAPVRIIGDDNGKVVGIECVKMELSEPGEDGRQKPMPVAGSEHVIEVDVVIKAIGQTRYTELIEAFELDHLWGVVTVNEETMQTSNPKVFAVGDVIFGNGQGEAMVVTAVQQGKDAAYSIHEVFQAATQSA